jgi:hypothetical protein
MGWKLRGSLRGTRLRVEKIVIWYEHVSKLSLILG